jgi:hypothetical protein
MEDIREVPISEEEYDRAYADYLTYWKHSRNVARALSNLIRARSRLRSRLEQDSDAMHPRPSDMFLYVPDIDEELEEEFPEPKPKTREEFIEWYNKRPSFIRRNQE